MAAAVPEEAEVETRVVNPKEDWHQPVKAPGKELLRKAGKPVDAGEAAAVAAAVVVAVKNDTTRTENRTSRNRGTFLLKG